VSVEIQLERILEL